MAFVGGPPPGPHSGEMSPLTKSLRPPLGLPPGVADKARQLRRRGRHVLEIADVLGATEEEVRHALATLRTTNPAPTRKTLNVTVAAHEFALNERERGEACWETVDRLLGELAIRRAMMGSPITRAQGRP